MTPSIEVRLESVIHGLKDVIVPAIDPNEALAVEQADLIVAQLSILVRQLPYADRYYRLCRDDARDTAAGLIRDAEGGPVSMAAVQSLGILVECDSADSPHVEYLALAGGIAALTVAAGEDGETGWGARIDATVRAFAIRQNQRERIWFKDAGFDTDAASLPDLAQLCA